MAAGRPAAHRRPRRRRLGAAGGLPQLWRRDLQRHGHRHDDGGGGRGAGHGPSWERAAPRIISTACRDGRGHRTPDRHPHAGRDQSKHGDDAVGVRQRLPRGVRRRGLDEHRASPAGHRRASRLAAHPRPTAHAERHHAPACRRQALRYPLPARPRVGWRSARADGSADGPSGPRRPSPATAAPGTRPRHTRNRRLDAWPRSSTRPARSAP